MSMKDHLPILVDRVLAGGEQLVEVGLFDRMAAKFNLDIGEIADEAIRAIARPDVFDCEAGHAFGELDCFAHRELARVHVGDETAFDPAALALAGAEYRQSALFVGPRDHRADLGRADIQGSNQRLVGDLRH
jgi:hypothetical protein